MNLLRSDCDDCITVTRNTTVQRDKNASKKHIEQVFDGKMGRKGFKKIRL